MFRDFATPAQMDKYMKGIMDGTVRIMFGLTEPKHGSDATYMETRAVRDPKRGGWIINGSKMWNTGMQ